MGLFTLLSLERHQRLLGSMNEFLLIGLEQHICPTAFFSAAISEKGRMDKASKYVPGLRCISHVIVP